MELVNAMLQWVEVETTMTINEVLLTVDPTCNIAIETFSEPECQSSTTDQTTGICIYSIYHKSLCICLDL